jgi:hypothetical protein
MGAISAAESLVDCGQQVMIGAWFAFSVVTKEKDVPAMTH